MNLLMSVFPQDLPSIAEKFGFVKGYFAAGLKKLSSAAPGPVSRERNGAWAVLSREIKNHALIAWTSVSSYFGGRVTVRC